MTFKIKEERFLKELQYVSPSMLIVLGHFAQYCKDTDKDCMITNVLEDFGATTVHSDGRALDFRTHGWTESEIKGAICFVKHCCGHLGAISSSTNMPNVMLYHKIDGNAYHFHAQVSR